MSKADEYVYYARRGDVEALDMLLRELRRTNGWNTTTEAGEAIEQAYEILQVGRITYRTLIETVHQIIIGVPVSIVAMRFPFDPSNDLSELQKMGMADMYRTVLDNSVNVRKEPSEFVIRFSKRNGTAICLPTRVFVWIAEHTFDHPRFRPPLSPSDKWYPSDARFYPIAACEAGRKTRKGRMPLTNYESLFEFVIDQS